MILKRTGLLKSPGSADTTAARQSSAVVRTPAGFSMLQVGTTLQERYEIQRVLGRGGMSTVYRARDRRFRGVERIVAIKEMYDSSQDAAARRMRLATFEREASLLATLQHAAIPKIFDYFTHNGRIYLILECIEGQNLEMLLDARGESVPEDQVVEWGMQICELLSYLHNHKPTPIIFRDLKPSNIMLRQDSTQIVLIDFGIARTFQEDQRGTMIGTEGYAPPEQYRGLAGPPGDLFALGATLHHLATNSDPRLETPFTFHQRPPCQLNPKLSAALEAVILKAVAYEASERFATAEEMRQALAATRNVTVAPPLPVPVIEPAVAPLPARPARKAAPRRRATAPVQPEASQSERLLWSVATADEVRSSPVVDGGFVYFGSYDGHMYAIAEADGSIAWRAATGRGVCSTAAVTPTSVVFGSEDNSVYAIDRSTGRRQWSYRTGLPVRASGRIVDDSVVIGSDDGYVYCLDLRSGAERWKARTWSHVRSSCGLWGASAIVGSDDGFLYAIALESGQVLWRFQTSGPIISSPAVLYDRAFFGSMDGALYAVDCRTGERLWRSSTGQPVLASLALHDQMVYGGSSSGLFMAIDAATGELQWEYQDPGQITSTAAVDEDHVYFGSSDGHVRCLRRADGELVWEYQTGGPVPSSPAVASQVLYIGSTDHRLYALHTGPNAKNVPAKRDRAGTSPRRRGTPARK